MICRPVDHAVIAATVHAMLDAIEGFVLFVRFVDFDDAEEMPSRSRGATTDQDHGAEIARRGVRLLDRRVGAVHEPEQIRSVTPRGGLSIE
ncbi:hypothetical protein [Rhodoblastus sp.]|uniref:hypothetical protein n=1 Tax=Rhodoblastus sp. TaxID=1962975 RepID=UPI0035B37BDB